MGKLLFVLLFLIVFQVPVNSAELNTVVLREWDNGKNIEYLEYTNKNRRGNLSSYTIKTVFGEAQTGDPAGSYDVAISKYILDCTDKVYRLNKTYFLSGEDLVSFKKYDDLYYKDSLKNGWEDSDSNKIQSKIAGILCE